MSFFRHLTVGGVEFGDFCTAVCCGYVISYVMLCNVVVVSWRFTASSLLQFVVIVNSFLYLFFQHSSFNISLTVVLMILPLKTYP